MLHTVPDPASRAVALREVLAARQADIDFESDPQLASTIAALGLWREIGTPNDQLSQYLRDADAGTPVPLDCARAEVIDYRGNIGVRIWYEQHARLTSISPHVKALLHPGLSFNSDGTLQQAVIFPITIARILKLEDTKLVIVPSWALELPFANLETHAVDYYLNFANPDQWAGVPYWAMHFCQLIKSRRIPFFTTHDLTAHIAGFRSTSWAPLIEVADRISACLERLFAECAAPPIQALILPFMAGYLLDVLAQPIHRHHDRMLVVIDELLEEIEARTIRAREPGTLRRFPQSYTKVLELILARSPPTEDLAIEVRRLLRDVVSEIKQHLALPDRAVSLRAG